MTIFHVLKYTGHTGAVTEYPAWVMDRFREWSKLGRRDTEQAHHYLDQLLAEYDPEVHGAELHADKYMYILGDVPPDGLHFILSTVARLESRK